MYSATSDPNGFRPASPFGAGSRQIHRSLQFVRQQRRLDVHDTELRRIRACRFFRGEPLHVRLTGSNPSNPTCASRASDEPIRSRGRKLHTRRQRDRRITHIRLSQAFRFERRRTAARASPPTTPDGVLADSCSGVTTTDGENGSVPHPVNPRRCTGRRSSIHSPRPRSSPVRATSRHRPTTRLVPRGVRRARRRQRQEGLPFEFACGGTRLSDLVVKCAAGHAFPTARTVVPRITRVPPRRSPGSRAVPPSRWRP